MPSIEHEALVSLFQHRPALAAELLQVGFGVKVPEHARACLESGDLSEIAPVEFRADAVSSPHSPAGLVRRSVPSHHVRGASRAVVVLRDGEDHDGLPVLAVVVEVQRRRDARKRRSWPMYLAALHARLGCDVALLVVCPHRAVAAWCAKPIRLGHPGFELRPLVAGPDAIPIIDDVAAAWEDPELAVLSALAHPVDEVVDALAHGLEALDPETAAVYTGYVLELLPAAAKKYLEDLLATQAFTYSSPFTQQYVEQGRVEGRAAEAAEAVLRVLAARGVTVPDDVRDRIRSCTDHDLLTDWLTRAVHVETAADLFD